jgi:hypothetical protein
MARHRSHSSYYAAGSDAGQAANRFDTLKLLLFWSYVLIPLGWGVTATVKKALLLFA